LTKVVPYLNCCCSFPYGSINKGKALDRKPGASTRILPSSVWASETCTIGCHGERLAYRLLPKQ